MAIAVMTEAKEKVRRCNLRSSKVRNVRRSTWMDGSTTFSRGRLLFGFLFKPCAFIIETVMTKVLLAKYLFQLHSFLKPIQVVFVILPNFDRSITATTPLSL